MASTSLSPISPSYQFKIKTKTCPNSSHPSSSSLKSHAIGPRCPPKIIDLWNFCKFLNFYMYVNVFLFMYVFYSAHLFMILLWKDEGGWEGDGGWWDPVARDVRWRQQREDKEGWEELEYAIRVRNSANFFALYSITLFLCLFETVGWRK